MSEIPFLNRFRQAASTDQANEEEVDELYYCLDQKLNVTREGRVFWSARSRRRPTTCYSKGHRLKSGYTRSGKWKASRWINGKSDKRAGK